MRHKKQDVNSLLQRSADEQLADFDWERLNAAIRSRLDEGQRRKTSVIGFGVVIRIAAGMAAAAAITLIAVTVVQREPVQTPVDTPGTAVVRVSERQGTARVEIIRPDESPKRDQSDGAWIVVAGYAPRFADDRVSRDMISMVRLF